MKLIKLYSFIIFLFGAVNSFAQEKDNNSKTVTIEWETTKEITNDFGTKKTILNFKNATYQADKSFLPIYHHLIEVSNEVDSIIVKVFPLKTRLATSQEAKVITGTVSKELEIEAHIETHRKKATASFAFVPIISAPDGIRLVTEFTFSYKTFNKNVKRKTNALTYKANSVLSSGKWAKVGITKNGVYQLTYSDLTALGIISQPISSEKIRLFGHGGHHIPFSNSATRIDDLKENAIEVIDGGDGIFSGNDYILFYAMGPHQWEYLNDNMVHVPHLFADTSNYFLTTDYSIGLPKRISKVPDLNISPDVTVDAFNDFQHHEVDLVNLVKSGRNWYGENFQYTKSREFAFNFPNAVPNTGRIRARSGIAVTYENRTGNLTYDINGNTILTLTSNGIRPADYPEEAKPVSGIEACNIPSSPFNLRVNFDMPSSSDNAWIDYIEITCQRKLIFNENQFSFLNLESRNNAIVRYQLTGAANYRIWDVTDPQEVFQITKTGNSFTAEGNELKKYIGFNGTELLKPILLGSIANQDLHNIQQADYVIVSHPNFLLQAQQLKAHHENYDRLNTVVVTPQQIYNEFSSGMQDITAIKTFMKMLYDRAGLNTEFMPKYLLLLGDGSYDLKNRLPNNTNFVPSYQSYNSTHPLVSYVSDDYFGLLDDSESDLLTDGVDIGIGRFVAQNSIQAQSIVNKVIQYSQGPDHLAPWHNVLTFVADDEDNNSYVSQSETFSNNINDNYPIYNHTKIYLDAYKQVSNSGGNSYPEVNKAIDNATENGALVMCYIGHGGELGWAHERVLGLTQINNYTNFKRLPLYLTATCEFSRFDDPERTSGGELVHLNPSGGGIALLTTTRVVYDSYNKQLITRFFDEVFEQTDGRYPRLGDLTRLSKEGISATINRRNFTLLGDPALMLRYPSLNVNTTAISDTIKSLQKVKIEGIITNESNQIETNYNGIIYPIVFDKPIERQTLNNDNINAGKFDFVTQNNALFNGKVSVTNGKFDFEFIVPKDINFDFGLGKISYFAENGTVTAAGADKTFYIGGRDGNPDADQTGPTVNVYLNDDSFIEGGITDENPMIYATFFDENGINTTGTGIGHDITAIIDENTTNPIILNEFYSTDLNTYQSGSLNYNLSNLAEGKHTIRLKAWDVYNNSGEGFTEFYVAQSENFKIEHVLNYPNPFTTNTNFYFEHNAIGQTLTIRIQIFTISGKLVKTIDNVQQSENYRSNPINWNGLDEFNDKLATGTYIYNVKVTNSQGETAEKFEKIVIL